MSTTGKREREGESDESSVQSQVLLLPTVTATATATATSKSVKKATTASKPKKAPAAKDKKTLPPSLEAILGAYVEQYKRDLTEELKYGMSIGSIEINEDGTSTIMVAAPEVYTTPLRFYIVCGENGYQLRPSTMTAHESLIKKMQGRKIVAHEELPCEGAKAILATLSSTTVCPGFCHLSAEEKQVVHTIAQDAALFRLGGPKAKKAKTEKAKPKSTATSVPAAAAATAQPLKNEPIALDESDDSDLSDSDRERDHDDDFYLDSDHESEPSN